MLPIHCCRNAPQFTQAQKPRQLDTIKVCMITYHDRKFHGTSNYESGHFDSSVVFHYRQQNCALWGTFSGKHIRVGTFVAKAVSRDGDILAMSWQYLSDRSEFHSGFAELRAESLPDGRLRLHERWAALLPDAPSIGESIIEEIAADTRQHDS
jgi:hypothetical protein